MRNHRRSRDHELLLAPKFTRYHLVMPQMRSILAWAVLLGFASLQVGGTTSLGSCPMMSSDEAGAEAGTSASAITCALGHCNPPPAPPAQDTDSNDEEQPRSSELMCCCAVVWAPTADAAILQGELMTTQVPLVNGLFSRLIEIPTPPPRA